MTFAPVQASDRIKEKYLRYLRTIFRISDPTYAKEFERELGNERAFAAGPYVDVTDSFVKGHNPADLIACGDLSAGFRKIALPLTRSLYKHQEQAIERISKGHNVVVSTGTGSGKTESFLIPVFDYLLRESEKGALGPGVRALFIYPMNALANDQVERLRKLLSACPEITYGSYTGQTKHKYNAALAEYRSLNNGATPLPNELIAREQMLETPPHILITNYAMLEYLMIRPDESVFFSSRYADKWRFVVLDEAHVYHGSTGIEVSMLLRRLKARLQNDALQYVLTSATLGGDEDNAGVAKFARNLCDRPFLMNDVIRAERINLTPQLATQALPRAFYTEVARLLDEGQTGQSILAVIRKYDNSVDLSLPAEAALYQMVLHDTAYHQVRQHLENPLTVVELANRMNWSPADVANFVTVATHCEFNGDQLFDARYHMFLRATESVFITLPPNKKLFLNRKRMHYETDGTAYKVFEISTCGSCHAIYLVGDEREGYLEQCDRADGLEQKSLFLLADAISDTDADHTLESEHINAEEYEICGKCGHLRKNDLLSSQYCEHGYDSYIKVYKVKVSTASGTLTKCVACENVNSQGILRMFFTGQEAVTSVIGTALFEELPSYVIKHEQIFYEEDDTGFGGIVNREQTVEESIAKQFIAFSDSRQAAAFYSSYLDTTYRNFLYKRLIVETMENMSPPGIQPLNQFADNLIYQYERNQIAVSNVEETRKEAWKAILNEIVNNNGLTSLSSLGLIGLAVNDTNIPENSKFNLSSSEVAAICSVFGLGMMSDAAVNYPINLTKNDKQFFTHHGTEYDYTYSDPDQKNFRRGFIPSGNQTNKRLDYLQRVLAKGKVPVSREQGIKMLKAIWERIFVAGGLVKANRRGGYRLETAQINVVKPTAWFICSRCRKITNLNVRGVCPSYRCEGELRPVDPAQHYGDNHYYQLFRTMDIQELRVVEHTAQLDRETAYEYQKKFQQKQIDVLSCSTTFEMGVDVGTLETVFMRNMPPSPANYAQRAGRAGRSKQSAAYAVTFCNKSSHDFTFFRQPENMIRGRIAPPQFNVENEKIAIRHLYASALGHFWSEHEQYFSGAAAMNEASDNGKSGVDVFKEYLASRPERLRLYLHRFLPPALSTKFGVDDFGWVAGLVGIDGALTKAVADYDYELGVLLKNREELYKSGVYGIDRLNARIRLYQKESILAFLSRKNVLPKYGFPVDTVEMQAGDFRGSGTLGVQLQRDLAMAISEYAPDSQVVANGHLFTSRYIRKVPKLHWKMFDYAFCEHCNTLNIEQHVEPPGETLLHMCRLCQQPLPKIGVFLIPAFGFESDSEVTKPGLKRPERTYRGEVAYVGYRDNIVTETHMIGVGCVDVGVSPNDEMAVLNDSPFFVCESCGYSELDEKHYGQAKQNKHDNPAGYTCPNRRLNRFALGYRFETDVILLHFQTPELTNWDQALSVLYGLLRGVSQHLTIEENEIAGCLLYHPNRVTRQPNFALVLFDRTPGGAGHVRRLAEPAVLENALRTSLKLMQQCDCGGEQADSSCYACLRNYYNQRQHDRLQRGYVLDFLTKLLPTGL